MRGGGVEATTRDGWRERRLVRGDDAAVQGLDEGGRFRGNLAGEEEDPRLRREGKVYGVVGASSASERLEGRREGLAGRLWEGV